MEQFLLNLLKTSLLGALAILLMLVSKPLWRERYRAKARCWLWLALAAFLLFPVDFSVKDAPVQAAPRRITRSSSARIKPPFSRPTICSVTWPKKADRRARRCATASSPAP